MGQNYEQTLELRAQERQERRQAFQTMSETASRKMEGLEAARISEVLTTTLEGRTIGGHVELERIYGTMSLTYDRGRSKVSCVMPFGELGTEADYHEDLPVEAIREATILIDMLDVRKVEHIEPERIDAA